MQKICIVIPCYNEGRRLNTNEFIDFISNNQYVYFCFVNDGSDDDTLQVLYNLKDSLQKSNVDVSHVNILNLDKNKGKAEAVRLGINEAVKWVDCDAVGYFDADLSAPLSEISNLQAHLFSAPNLLFAFGSRIKKIGSNIQRKAKRHYLGRIFSTIASLMLKMDVYDTQCGAKLFHKEMIPLIFTKSFISRWLFDIEIFYRIKNIYGLDASLKIMSEVPLNTWINKAGSKISFVYLFKVPFELLRIYLKYRD